MGKQPLTEAALPKVQLFQLKNVCSDRVLDPCKEGVQRDEGIKGVFGCTRSSRHFRFLPVSPGRVLAHAWTRVRHEGIPGTRSLDIPVSYLR